MDLGSLGQRDWSRIYDELARLRGCLRPLSAESGPSFQPVEEIWSADDQMVFITPNVEQILGWQPARIKKMSPGLSLFRPGDIEPTYAHWYRCLMGWPVRDVEFRLAHADGRGYVWLLDDMQPRLRHADGRVRDVRILSHDVTALRARELDFLIDCLGGSHFRRDREALHELGIPELPEQRLPGCPGRPGGKLLRYRRLNALDGTTFPTSRRR